MPYAIEMFFDEKSEGKIRDIWRLLHENEICSYMFTSGSRPHITLTVLNSIDISKFSTKLKIFTEKLSSLQVKFDSIGSFPGKKGVLFLSPTVTEELLEMHKEFNTTFSQNRDEMWSYYLPGVWVPHCTLAVDLPKSNLPLAMKFVLDDFQTMNAWVEEIGIVEFRPVKHLGSFKLNK